MAALTLAALEEELSHWTFLPGYRFELRRLEPARIGGMTFPGLVDTALLVIHSRVPNTYQPDRVIDVQASVPVPWYVLEGKMSVGDFLRQSVRDRMIHEADEWLKRDGTMVFDPHAPVCPVCRRGVRRVEVLDDDIRHWHTGAHILGDTPCLIPKGA